MLALQTAYCNNKNNYINLTHRHLHGGYQNQDSDVPIPEEVKLFLSKVNNSIKSFIYDKKTDPIYSYDQLKEDLIYSEKTKTSNKNCHLGQRKLLLTEIEFYNKFVDSKQMNNVVIYAGSASCEHLPVILTMYPNLKFILIDPNYHAIDAKYKYIYQNVASISKSNHKLYTDIKPGKNKRLAHLHPIVKELHNVDFIYDYDNTYDMFDIYNDTHIEKMNNFKDLFEKNDKNVIDLLLDSDNRIFIIQDYMDIKLTLLLKKYIKNATYEHNIYFLTDIRTVLIPKYGASDIDILYNSALQIIYLKELRPVYSMLKFRTPMFLQNAYNSIKNIYDDNLKNYEFAKDVFDYVIDNYDVDLLKNYLDHKFFYFQNNFIFVQPWAPTSSTESRLFVSNQNIDLDFVNYDNLIWENRFFYFRYIRLFKYYPVFYEITKKYADLHYDGCQDCAREIMILTDYMIHDDNKEPTYDISKLSNHLNDPDSIIILTQLYNLINKYTFYDLSPKNYKCTHADIMHGKHKKYRNYINIYDADSNIITVHKNGHMNFRKND